MNRTKLQKKLRAFDLFCLLNSCGIGGYCEPKTIYCLLLGLDIDIPPPSANPVPYWHGYLNGTSYSTVVSFSPPYFYSLGDSWRWFQMATKAWAERVAAFAKDDFDAFAAQLPWCHPFPLTLAFLTYRTWKMLSDRNVNFEQTSYEFNTTAEEIAGLTMVALLQNGADGEVYLAVATKALWLHQTNRFLPSLRINGDGCREIARWLGCVFLLIPDNLPYQLPGLKSRSKKKAGSPSGVTA